jgi:hypothetical protein
VAFFGGPTIVGPPPAWTPATVKLRATILAATAFFGQRSRLSRAGLVLLILRWGWVSLHTPDIGDRPVPL